MAYEPRRTLLVGLSALAVVFAAALFPAAGVGSHPGGDVGVGVPGETVPESTPTQVTERPDDPTPTGVGDEPTDDTPTATPSPTETPTEAPPPPNDGGGDFWSGLSLMALLGLVARGFGFALVGLALLSLAVIVRGAEPGTPRVELPFGWTVTLPFTVPTWAGSLGTSVSRLTMGFVVSISASVTQLLDASGAALRAVASGLGIVAGEGLRGSAKLFATLPRALAGGLAGIAAVPAALASIPGALSTVGSTLSPSADRPGEDAREMAPDPVQADEPEDTGPPTVEEAWVAMTDLLPVERTASTTPAEFARRAVDRGFPARPIHRLTRAFEDVVYGGYSPGDRARAARDALSSLRERLGGGA